MNLEQIKENGLVSEQLEKRYNTKFIRFVSDYFYVKDNKVFKSAEYQLNDWLKGNPQVVIEEWKMCATGKDNALTIVVKYTEC